MASLEEMISRHPELFHMAESGSWSSISRHGLLSTSALLDLFQIGEPQRTTIESEWRPCSIEIRHPEHGVASIRDQAPMSPASLAKLLDGLTTSDWYRILNGKSFFWATKERLMRFLTAGAYKNKVHDVLTVDTGELLRRHTNKVTVAYFNTGVSQFGPKFRRGIDTFKRFDECPPGNEHPKIVEVVVDYSVPDIAEFTKTVQQFRGRLIQQTVWSQ